MPRGTSSPRGFTILEIIVVVAIMAALMGAAAIIIPAAEKKQKARQVSSAYDSKWEFIEDDFSGFGLRVTSVPGGHLYIFKSASNDVAMTFVPSK